MMQSSATGIAFVAVFFICLFGLKLVPQNSSETVLLHEQSFLIFCKHYSKYSESQFGISEASSTMLANPVLHKAHFKSTVANGKFERIMVIEMA